jgi:cation diffusion facilitator CzcD-associated flavoprotein CzcO
MEQRADLVILGGGYSAVNALEAAAFHLPANARVFVIARETGWGGQWVEQYEYVRLHQPYEAFTAGRRKWDLKKQPQHLASKPEILRHLTDITRACVEEKNLDLVGLFQYEYEGHEEDSEQVTVHARCITPELGLPTMRIVADKLIKATGAKIIIKKPLAFSTQQRITSLTPKDVLTPEWNIKMRFGEDAAREIWVIGSGKTAMDVLYHLGRNLPGAAERLRCVAGRGTWFMSRDLLNPHDFWEKNSFGKNTPADWLIEMVEKYDGSNASKVMACPCIDLL